MVARLYADGRIIYNKPKKEKKNYGNYGFN